MTAEVISKMTEKSTRRVFNPLTGETLDNSFLSTTFSEIDLIDILIEGNYQAEKKGEILHIFKP